MCDEGFIGEDCSGYGDPEITDTTPFMCDTCTETCSGVTLTGRFADVSTIQCKLQVYEVRPYQCQTCQVTLDISGSPIGGRYAALAIKDKHFCLMSRYASYHGSHKNSNPPNYFLQMFNHIITLFCIIGELWRSIVCMVGTAEDFMTEFSCNSTPINDTAHNTTTKV